MSSIFQRVLGAISSFFQFGGPNGPGLNANGAALEAKDSTNSVFVPMRASSTPVLSNDCITLGYLQSPAGSPVQTFNRLEYWGGQSNGSTGLAGFLSCFLVSGAGHNPPIPLSTNLLTSTKRCTFVAASGSGAAVVMGICDGDGILSVWRGNGVNEGGFTLRLRFAFEAAGTGSSHSVLAGLISQSGVLSGHNWQTQNTLATIGVGFTQTPAPNFTGNWQLIHSVGDGATAPTVLDTGIPITITSLMQLDLFVAPGGANIAYTLTDLSTSQTTSGFVAANYPSSTQFLAMWCADTLLTGPSTSTSQFSVAEYAYQQQV